MIILCNCGESICAEIEPLEIGESDTIFGECEQCGNTFSILIDVEE